MKKLKTLSLRTQIIFLIIVLSFSTVAISLSSMLAFTKQLNATLISNQEQHTLQQLHLIENAYNEIDNISRSIAYNQLVQQYLTETNLTIKMNLYKNITTFFNNMKTLDKNIVDISILGETGNSMSISKDESVYYSLYDKVDINSEKINFFGKVNFNSKGKSYIRQVIAEPVYEQKGNTKSFIGIVFITIDPFSFFEEFSVDYYNSLPNVLPNNFILVDKNNELIFGDMSIYNGIDKTQNFEESFILEVNKERYKVRQKSFDLLDAKIYSYISYSNFQRNIMEISIRQLFLIIVLLIIITIILLAIVQPIMQSLDKLNKIMLRISSRKKNSLHERIVIDSEKSYCKEVINTSIVFNKMLDEINLLNQDIFNNYTKMYEMEIINRKTEIAFLRSQINPHFLYNTLTLINGMASVGAFNEIIDITQALSRIYRYSIKKDDLVTVEQELEIIKNYVMIQTARFENRFTVSYNFAPETLDALIPSMILQPLVENAITHGLEKSFKKGTLEIGCRINHKDNTIVLWVYDTGVGMSQEKLDLIRKSLHQYTNPQSSDTFSLEESYTQEESIGLQNVSRRISLYFGQDYRLKIDSEKNIGTNVQIKIPYEKHRRYKDV